MLILSRKIGESIVIDGRITVKVIRVEGEAVKLGIEAPLEIPVHRQEVYDEIQKSNKEALTDPKAKLPRLSANDPGKLDSPPGGPGPTRSNSNRPRR